MSTKEKIRDFVNSPLAWVLGGIASVVTFFASFGVDPVTTGTALAAVLVDQSMNIFTAASIAGFTLAPEVPWLPAKVIQLIAIVAGSIVVVKIILSVWDRIKARTVED